MKKKAIWLGLALLSAVFFSWVFGNIVTALAVMLMIGLHEGGHLMFAKWCGLKTGGFYFLPGLGGVSMASEESAKRRHDFWIYYGGPLTGAVLVMILGAIYLGLGQGWPLVYQNATLYILFLWSIINLFNLFPIFPLDGGGMVWAIVKSFWKGYSPWWAMVFNGLAILGFAYLTHSVFWVIMLLFFGYQGIKARHQADLTTYKQDMGKAEVALCILVYIVLVVFFVLTSGYFNQPLLNDGFGN